MRFGGKTILITGAGSGIGRASAELLAGEDVGKLLLIDRDGKSLEDLALKSPARRIAGDVASEDFWNGLELGPIDHAIINAGIAGSGSIAQSSFEEWRKILSVNLDGAFLTLRASLRSMANGGSIVAVSSAAGLKAEPGDAAYGSSKAALIQLARIAAKEAATRQIRVNVIAPGGVETAMWDKVPMFASRASEVGRAEAFAEIAQMATPLKRFASAEEIAGQIAFLLSDACKTVTGTVLISDGGYTL